MAKASDALAVCQDHVPDEASGLRLLLATPTTAGEITDELRTARKEPIHPWDTLAPGHAVSKCNFGTDPDEPVTTWLIDDAGRTTRDTSVSSGT